MTSCKQIRQLILVSITMREAKTRNERDDRIIMCWGATLDCGKLAMCCQIGYTFHNREDDFDVEASIVGWDLIRI